MTTEPKYDVALSFAGEQRHYVDAVAAALRDAGVKVFYDDYEQVQLWGKDLYEHLDWVYRKASQYCIVFISEAYQKKVWTNHERRSAQARAIQENSEYLLPARFDDTELPGLPGTIGYVDAKSLKPEQLAELIREKLGPPRAEPGFPRKVDRLWDALHLKGTSPKMKGAKRDSATIARSFYAALQRMTTDERRVVASVLAFGCPGDLPDGVHISLDYLSRVTGMPKAQLTEHLAAVRSLNIKAKVRSPKHQPAEGELVPDDRDILLTFWAPEVPHSKEATRVAYMAVRCAGYQFCGDHGVLLVSLLDFRRLSKAYKGPLAAPHVHEPEDSPRHAVEGSGPHDHVSHGPDGDADPIDPEGVDG